MICWFPVLPFSLWNVDTWLISASVKSPWPLGLRSHGPRALLRHLRAKVWGRGGETGEAWGLNLHYLSLLAGGHGCTIPRFLVSTAGCLSQENVKGIMLWASRVTTWISGEPRTGPFNLLSWPSLICANPRLKCRQVELTPRRVEAPGSRDPAVLWRVWVSVIYRLKLTTAAKDSFFNYLQ